MQPYPPGLMSRPIPTIPLIDFSGCIRQLGVNAMPQSSPPSRRKMSRWLGNGQPQ